MKTYDAKETAKLIRIELKAAFKGQKFSVTSSRRTVSVSWVDGCSWDEVSAITTKFGGMSFDGMQDLDVYSSAEYNGETVRFYCYNPSLNRTFTEEFAYRVAAKVEKINPRLNLRVEMHPSGCEVRSTGSYGSWECRALSDIIITISAANIDEPVEQKQAEEIAAIAEEIQFSAETKCQEITPISITSVDEFKGSGIFPNSNKNCTIEEYHGQARSNTIGVRITDQVELSPADYDIFTQTLMSGQPWLAGKGGGGSATVDDSVGYDEIDWIQYRKGAYSFVVEVSAVDRPTLYINPEGYDYARYVGFPVAAEQAAPAPRPILAIVPAPLPLVHTGLRHSYGKWVEALLTQGSIDLIVSYEQWCCDRVPILYQEWVSEQLAQGAIDQIVSLTDWIAEVA